jgi:DNA polymerase
MQNLSARKSRELRKQLEAPPGYVLVGVDAAQIEARLVAWLAGQISLLTQFANGEDVYCNFASLCFNRPVTRKEQLLRFVGKTCILGLGFGMSAPKLLRTLRLAARGMDFEIKFDEDDAQGWVSVYRRNYSKIPMLWYECNNIIELMAQGRADGKTIGPCTVEGTTIMLPSGLRLYYENLRVEGDEYWFTYGGRQKKIYGAKLLENIVQALDRQHVLEAALCIEKRAAEAGIDARLLLQEHDGNVMLARERDANMLARIALREMRRPCAWGTGLPLDAEVKIGLNYGEMETYSWSN